MDMKKGLTIDNIKDTTRKLRFCCDDGIKTYGNYEQDELMMSKSKTHELAKEIDRLLYEKSVEDDPVLPLSVFVCKCVSLCTVLYFDLQ